MKIIQAIILGIVQGLTEFLPISSSGHLNVFPWIFNWEMLSDGMDVALHIGTLLALVIFFFKDWVKLVKAGYKKVVKKEDSKVKAEVKKESKKTATTKKASNSKKTTDKKASKKTTKKTTKRI